MPITNDAGIVQISPGASGVDLTQPAEGYPDSPDRYRPSGEVTFARVVPNDAVQASALAEWAGELELPVVASELARGTPFDSLMLSEFDADAGEVGVDVAEPGLLTVVGGGKSPDPFFVAGAGPVGPGC